MKNNKYRWLFFWQLMVYDLLRWKIKSNKIPLPYLLKRKIIKQYFLQNKIDYFVETGTCYGDMLAGLKNIFKKAFSIELDKALYANACKRFSNDNHIKIILGDSSKKLKSLIPKIDKPTLFYLDAHFSGENTAGEKKHVPLLDELKILLKIDNIHHHIILIDDARCLGKNNYPKYLEIKKLVKLNKDLTINNEMDIIRILNNKHYN